MSKVSNPSLRARRLALLLGGAAAVALLVGQPASAITINDLEAAATPGGVPNYWDQTNIYSNVVAIDIGLPEGFLAPCTGTLINARTILTAAHCFVDATTGKYDGGTLAVSFSADASTNPNPQKVSTTIIYPGWTPNRIPSNDIALVALATPVPNPLVPMRLTANPGDPNFPPNGAVVAVVGYGASGTGSTPFNQLAFDGKRRFAYTQLGAYDSDLKDQQGQPAFSNQNGQPLFGAQFRDPKNPNLYNAFGPSDPPPMRQGGVAPGDSGGPLLWCPLGTPDQCALDQLVLLGVLAVGGGEEKPKEPTAKSLAGPQSTCSTRGLHRTIRCAW